MANTIILKRSATPGKVPTTTQLALGEIAINTYDGLIYIKKDNGTASIAQIGGVTSVNGETGTITITSDDVSDSGQTNKWFANSLARGAISGSTGISYNSSTGVISTSQNIATGATPTFAGLTLTGNMGITGNIVPSANNTYSLGSASYAWKDLYVGPGTLYVNGKAVISDTSGTMTFSTDIDQNMRITTTGTGVLQLGSSSTVTAVSGTLQIQSGKNITDSAGTSIGFGNAINMNTSKITGMGTPSASTDAATKGYVDSSISAISTSSITQGNSSVSVVDSGTGTVTVTVDGTTALTVDATGVVVAGNFTVSGTQTTVNANTIALADNIITLNSDTTGAPTQNAGIEVERGDEANVQIRWNEGSTKWTFTNDGATYNNIAVNTDGLTEGTTNLYHTTARARNALSATSATGVSYNSTTGAISLGSIPNSALTNNSITINGSAVALGGTRTLTTDDVAEGATNQYFTTTRARGAVSASTGIAYNSTTGAISTSAIPNASLSNSAVTVGSTSISLGSSATTIVGLTSVTSTGFTGALTGNADTATSAGKWTTARTITLAGDLTGSVSIDGSSNVTLTATVAGDGVALGTDTTGNYVASITNGSYITGGNGGSEGAALTLAVDATALNTASKVVARDASGNFAAGTITATLTGNVTGALTGNASTATILQTTRNIQGVSFNGGADITVVTAGTGISVSGTAVTNTGVTSLNSLTGAKTLAHYHATYQTVSAAQETSNASAAVTFTFADLSGSVHHMVLLNRVPLRPTEYSVSGTTLTIASGFGLVDGDEIEVTGSKLS